MVDPREPLKCEDCGKEMLVEETDMTVVSVGVVVGLAGPKPIGGCPDCGGQVYLLGAKEELDHG